MAIDKTTIPKRSAVLGTEKIVYEYNTMIGQCTK